MLKSSFIASLILLMPFYSSGQNWYNDTHSHPGIVILKDKSKIRGDLVYNQTAETLTIKSKNQKFVRTPEDAVFFQYYDYKKGFNRCYFSLPTEDGEEKFFELLLTGEIPLYRKSFISNNQVESEAKTTTIHLAHMLDYQLYYKNDGVIHRLNSFEDQILPLMKPYIIEVSNFIINEKLDTSTYADQVKAIDFFNQLIN